MMYDPVTDSFTQYRPADITPVKIKLPVFNNEMDLSDFAIGVTENGNVISKPSEPSYRLDLFDTPTSILRLYLNEEVSQEANNLSMKTNNIKGAAELTQRILERSNGTMLPYQAAAIVGHMVAESGLKSNSYNGNDLGQKSGGLAQWSDSRLKALKDYAKSRGTNWSDIDTLIDFIFKELGSTHKDGRNRLLISSNVDEASRAWSYYEKHAGYDGTTNTAKKAGWSLKRVNQEIEKRRKATEDVYKSWLQTYS